MALITCPECGKEISDKANICPHCGVPITIPNAQPDSTSDRIDGHKKLPFIIIIVLIVVALIISALVFARLSEYDQPSNPVEELIDDVFDRTIHDLDEVDPSVVTVYCYDMLGKEYGKELGTGSGFIAFDDQTIVTNFHVYEAGEDIRVVTSDGKEIPVASAIALSAKKDIAILKLEKPTDLQPLDFGDPTTIEKGDAVTAIGSPLGLANTFSEGIISRIYNEPSMDGIEIFQTTAPISHGSSGGALFDKAFFVVGVTFAGYDEGQNLNLAIPIDVVEEIYESKNVDDEAIREENLYNIAIWADLEEAKNSKSFFEHPEWQEEMFELAKKTPPYLAHAWEIEQGTENIYRIRDEQDILVRHRILNSSDYAIAKIMFKHITDRDEMWQIMTTWDIEYPEALIIMCTIGGYDWYNLDDDQQEAICNYIFDNKNGTIHDAKEARVLLEYFGYEVIEESDGSITAYW